MFFFKQCKVVDVERQIEALYTQPHPFDSDAEVYTYILSFLTYILWCCMKIERLSANAKRLQMCIS